MIKLVNTRYIATQLNINMTTVSHVIEHVPTFPKIACKNGHVRQWNKSTIDKYLQSIDINQLIAYIRSKKAKINRLKIHQKKEEQKAKMEVFEISDYLLCAIKALSICKQPNRYFLKSGASL